jgi:hypothetical protein
VQWAFLKFQNDEPLDWQEFRPCPQVDLSRFDAAPLIAFIATKEIDYAVRIALTSELTRKQVPDDLGLGMSTLNKWITAHRDTDVVSKEDLDLAQKNDRLCREILLPDSTCLHV